MQTRGAMIHVRYYGAAVLFTFVACATRTPGAKPHDMSAATHETTAAQEERVAAEHEQRYDPDAQQRRERCRAGRAAALEADPCWSTVTNPTAEHLKHAEEHRAHAADHRAASQALRDAEAQACRGVPASDRDESPFDHRDDIERIEPLYETTQTGKFQSRRLVGAVVVFRALPGLTVPWLQRVIDCHLARNSALGHEVPEMPYCPLVPKGVRATVSETRGGFAVEIRSDDAGTAKEIARRVDLLRER